MSKPKAKRKMPKIKLFWPPKFGRYSREFGKHVAHGYELFFIRVCFVDLKTNRQQTGAKRK